jgi:hypothetical protein
LQLIGSIESSVLKIRYNNHTTLKMSKAFFELLEQRFGRFADLYEPASVSRVLTSHKNIDAVHLNDLLHHKV